MRLTVNKSEKATKNQNSKTWHIEKGSILNDEEKYEIKYQNTLKIHELKMKGEIISHKISFDIGNWHVTNVTKHKSRYHKIRV